jgi:phage terminase small subunit
MKQKAQKFTPKQTAFISWYCSAVVNGNGTEAARRAGYAGNEDTLKSVASENLSKPYIRAEIDKRMAKALSGADVTVEAVLRRLQVIGDQALEDRKFGDAIRAAELQGKYLKMFTDRIEHVQNIEDISTDELRHLLVEIMEAGQIDIRGLVAKDDAGDGLDADRQGTQTTH